MRPDDPGFPDAALAWVAEQGLPPLGPPQLRVRPWSACLRVDTAQGVVWVKAGGSRTSYEAGLLRALAVYGAPHVQRPLAVDVDRGWVLLPDGGPTLRQRLDRDPDLGLWEQLLPRYAELQRSVEHRVLPGVPDLRPSLLPGLLDGLLDTVPVGPLAELRALQPRYAEWCIELDGARVLPTLQHDDLHDGNVFSSLVVFDLGDASLAHPFSSLLVTLRSIAARWSLSPGAPELQRLRDCYLEAWRDVHDRDDLEMLALLATRVGKVGRALSWQRSLADDPTGPDAEAVPGWLEELVEADVF